MTTAIKGFDLAFDHLNLAEKREFMQLMCRSVELHPDRVEVEAYQGRTAACALASNNRLQKVGGGRGGGGVPSAVSGEQGSRERERGTGGGSTSFVSMGEWLPVAALGKNVEPGGAGAHEAASKEG
jgi:hypothetical protein